MPRLTCYNNMGNTWTRETYEPSSLDACLDLTGEADSKDSEMPLGIMSTSADCLFFFEPDLARPDPDRAINSCPAAPRGGLIKPGAAERGSRNNRGGHASGTKELGSDAQVHETVRYHELSPRTESPPVSHPVNPPVCPPRGSFPLPRRRPPTPPHFDTWDRIKPLTVRVDRATIPWTRNLMENHTGHTPPRHRPLQAERRRTRQPPMVGSAAEACVNKIQARGIITRTKTETKTAAQSDALTPTAFSRRTTALPQNGPSLLSEAIQTAPATTGADAIAQKLRKSKPTSRSHTAPIVGFIPSGAHESATPLGKYYPTNWEARHKKGRMSAAVEPVAEIPISGSTPTSPTGTVSSSLNPPPRANGSPPREARPASSSSAPPPPPGLKPASAVSRSANPTVQVSRPVSNRPVSELSVVPSNQAQLLQYKRDMITQTAQKAKEVLHWAKAGGIELDEPSQEQLARRITLLHICNKPKSPKIGPTIMSPGPVTPMTLDGEREADYLTAKPSRHRAAQLSRSGDAVTHTA